MVESSPSLAQNGTSESLVHVFVLRQSCAKLFHNSHVFVAVSGGKYHLDNGGDPCAHVQNFLRHAHVGSRARVHGMARAPREVDQKMVKGRGRVFKRFAHTCSRGTHARLTSTTACGWRGPRMTTECGCTHASVEAEPIRVGASCRRVAMCECRVRSVSVCCSSGRGPRRERGTGLPAVALALAHAVSLAVTLLRTARTAYEYVLGRHAQWKRSTNGVLGYTEASSRKSMTV